MRLDSIFQPLLTYLATFSFILFYSPRYSLTFNHPTDPPAPWPGTLRILVTARTEPHFRAWSSTRPGVIKRHGDVLAWLLGVSCVRFPNRCPEVLDGFRFRSLPSRHVD